VYIIILCWLSALTCYFALEEMLSPTTPPL